MKNLRINTKRLFYGRWPYKIEFRLAGSALIKRWNLEKLKAWCKIDREERNKQYSWYKDVDGVKLLKFVEAIEPFLEQDHKLRAEAYTLNFYTDREDVVNALATSLNWCVRSIHAPATPEELDMLLNNKRKIICEVLPHNGYVYKVTLKENTPANTKLQLKGWCEQYAEETFKFTPSTTRWLTQSKNYLQSPFFYLKDEKLLMMCRLFLGANVRSVEEYIPRYTLISE